MKFLPAILAALWLAGCAPSGPRAAFRDCPDCPEMVVIPAGDFTMGSPANEPGRYEDESPQRTLHVGQLDVGKYDITRGQWAAFVEATHRPATGGCSWSTLPDTKPGEPNPAANWRNLGFEQDDSHPVVCVSFDDAQDYVRWLSQRTGHAYRLLTEAEWEYAARAGTTTPFPSGASISHELANYGPEDHSGEGMAMGHDRWVHTSPVGSFPPNAFGLYDMHGNVLQWVQDCYADDCEYRVVRGGDWGDQPALIRSAARNYAPVRGYTSTGLGFRVAFPPE